MTKNYLKIRFGKRIVLGGILLMISGLCGCSNPNSNEGTKVVLTTGFEKDEVFRIEKSSCMLPEIMVYLTNTKNQYENAFGAQIWDTSYEGKTLEDNIKETVLARLARVKALNLLAAEHGVTLSDEDIAKVNKAADKYYNSLSDIEKSELKTDKELIVKMYGEYALANRVYEYLIVDINPEISDDEARTITVQNILIKTYTLDEDGNKIEYSSQAKSEAYKRAQEALERLKAGEEFINIVSEYNEAENYTYSFGKGDMEASFEEIAFSLGTDEISDIVESSQGYHIIKCISTFDRSETDRNKLKIVEQRRKEAFGDEYSQFIGGLTKNINDKLWDKVSFIDSPDIKTSSFFDVYNDFFKTIEE